MVNDNNIIMKKINIKYMGAAALLLATLFTGCTSDDSDYGTPGKTYINLSGIDESYSVETHGTDKLVITPQISSSFADDDLEYTWAYYLTSKGQYSEYDASTNTYTYPKADTLSHSRALDEALTLPDGQYTLVYTVTSKSTGYSQSFKTSLNTASALANGFYILKENTEGNTDIDLYNPTKKTLISNVITANQGKAMSGKPRSMDVVYDMGYVDANNNKGATNSLLLTTESNNMQFMSLQDGQAFLTPANIHYSETPGEKVYRAAGSFYYNFLVTSNGVYTGNSGSGGGTGVFGANSGDGGSVHVAPGGGNSFYALAYWSDAAHAIEAVDYNGSTMPVNSSVDGYTATVDNAICIDCGHCEAGMGDSYFILQDKTDASKKWLYTVNIGFTRATITDVRAINADTHFAKASVRAINSLTATIGYAVDGNKLYSYNLAQETAEKELTLQDLPSDETITFVSNRYYAGSPSFDYLVIGTQKGNTYHLYFYNMIGGEPVNAPVFTISGEGKLKSLGYVNSSSKTGTDATLMPVLDE